MDICGTKPLQVEIFGKESIYIGRDFSEFIVEDILKNAVPKVRIIVIITDEHVAKLHLPSFLATFKNVQQRGDQQFGKQILQYVIPSGESSKSREMVAKIEDFLIGQSCNRDTCLIAMGGGVVGDLVGFIASTYLRGVPLIQLPTTLLAMADSSIGGKNGIDTPAGKNLIGTTYEPVRIYIDLAYLTTLPPRELFNGMAEVIKTCAISSLENFEFLESNIEKFSKLFLNRNFEDSATYSKLLQLLFESIKFKAIVTTNDREDLGQRQFLNFGHTVGHALEKHYSPYLLHGEAVSVGMVIEQEIATCLIGACPEVLDRLKNVLRKANLPTSILEAEGIVGGFGSVQPCTPEDLIRIMQLDKKNSSDQIRATLLAQLGLPFGNKATPVPKSEILRHLKIEIDSKSQKSKIKNRSHSETKLNEASIIFIGFDVNDLANQLADAMNWTFLKEISAVSDDIKERKVITLSKHWMSTSGKPFLREWMQANGIVIHIISDLTMNESLHDLESLSNYTYLFEEDATGQALTLAVNSILHIVNYANGKLFQNVMPSLEFRSFFLTLLLDDVTPILDVLPKMVSGTAAVELRIDVAWNSKPEFEIGSFKKYLAQQVSRIRKAIGDHPIIFTVRSATEGGQLPSKITEAELVEILEYAVKLGCEFIDLEISLNSNILTKVKQAASNKSRIIASYHSILKPIDWKGSEILTKLENAAAIGDIIKLVSVGISEKHNLSVQRFTDKYYSKSVEKLPLIAFNFGSKGRITRVKNRFFIPVTHEELRKMNNNSNLAQLTCQEILSTLTEQKIITPKKFFILGHNISYTLSPLIHNTNFDYFRLPFKYSIKDTNALDEIQKVIRDPDFGGGSVTIPHKQTIIPLLDSVSQVVQSIGAVNTIIVQLNGKLHGENTDWLGIQKCLERVLNMSKKERASSSAMLIGAGGTARAALFALNSFGFKQIYLYNRTECRLQELLKSSIVQESDTGTVLKIYKQQESLPNTDVPVAVIVDTTPGYSGMCSNSFVNKIFQHQDSAVLVKLAYGNMASEDEQLSNAIAVVTGQDIVLEQALWAAKLWTGLKPDAEHIRAVMRT